jgi:hypothetical protein
MRATLYVPGDLFVGRPVEASVGPRDWPYDDDEVGPDDAAMPTRPSERGDWRHGGELTPPPHPDEDEDEDGDEPADETGPPADEDAE